MKSYWRQTLFVSIFALFTSLFCKLLLHFDINKRPYNHVPGECGIIPNLSGVKDFATTTTIGKLFMIVNPMHEYSSEHTHLFTFDADHKTAKEIDLDQRNRNLSALSLFENYLFAYDELSTNVLVYTISDKTSNNTLKLRKTFKNREFKGLIGLASKNKSSFYFIKHNYYDFEIIRIFSRFFPFPKTGQILLQENKITTLIDEIAYPTDVVYDDFKKILYVASYSQNSIITYASDNIEKKNTFDIGCAPTSLWLDIDGSLLVTCHQIRIKTFASFLNSQIKNPSMVIRITIGGSKDDDLKITQYYSNDGATISEALQTVRAGRNILISNSEFILNCAI